MAREEHGTRSYDYDGPRCIWCNDMDPDFDCQCAMAQACRADMHKTVKAIVDAYAASMGDKWAEGFRNNTCPEADDPDGEAFRGREADGARSEQMAAWQRLK